MRTLAALLLSVLVIAGGCNASEKKPVLQKDDTKTKTEALPDQTKPEPKENTKAKEEETNADGPQVLNRKKVNEISAEWKKQYGGKEGYLVLPALLADKAAKEITFLGESTDITPGDIAEFFVIDSTSGHDYESIAISFAKPSDIRKALIFIGMAPGAPVSFKDNRFWPKGERVKMHIAQHSSPDDLLPAEQFVLDDRTGKTLPEEGFAFTGSILMPGPDGEDALAADSREPQSIASNYNEPETLLDIPYQGNQDALYDHLHANKETKLPDHVLLNIVLEPEHKDGKTRVCDLSLQAAAPENPSLSVTNYTYLIKDKSGTLLNDGKDLKSALDVISQKAEAGKDVFVSISFGDKIPVGRASQIAQVFASLESAGSIRIDQPEKGQLYYKAFTPNPAYLDRNARTGHPWELRLKQGEAAVTGLLTECEFVWSDDDSHNATVKATDHTVKTAEELRKVIVDSGKQREAEDKAPHIPVMLVVAPPEMTLGKIMDFIGQTRDIAPIVHIYALNE